MDNIKYWPMKFPAGQSEKNHTVEVECIVNVKIILHCIEIEFQGAVYKPDAIRTACSHSNMKTSKDKLEKHIRSAPLARSGLFPALSLLCPFKTPCAVDLADLHLIYD